MAKIKKVLVIIAAFMLSPVESFSDSQIASILKNQQLTVFDLGILRLREDLKLAKDSLKEEIENISSHIYTDAIYSPREERVFMIVSIPLSQRLRQDTYMADSIKCRNVFEIIKQSLLIGQNEGNSIYTQASGYLNSVFMAPSSWSQVSSLPGFKDKLVNFVDLEITLRPETKYALSNKVRPFSCGGNLATTYNEIIITRKFN